MADPLNIFLEDVEVLIRQTGDDDAELGRQVRAAWATMIDAENRTTASTHVITNRHGFPVQVTVSSEG